jgi:hypothetical protein
MSLRIFAQRCKRFTPLLAAPAALLLNQGQAKAVMTYNIFESAGNVAVQTSGSLNLTGATPNGINRCIVNGAIRSDLAVVCSGPRNILPQYGILGPASFQWNRSYHARIQRLWNNGFLFCCR